MRSRRPRTGSPWAASATLLALVVAAPAVATLPPPRPRLIAPSTSPTAAAAVTVGWDPIPPPTGAGPVTYEGGFCAVPTCRPAERFGSANVVRSPLFQGTWYFRVRAVRTDATFVNRLEVGPYGGIVIVADRTRPRLTLAEVAPRVEPTTVGLAPTIRLGFSEEVRRIGPGDVAVCRGGCRAAGDERVPAILTAATARTATLRLGRRLRPNTRYEIRLDGVVDPAGNPVRTGPRGYRWIVRTAARDDRGLLFPPALTSALDPPVGRVLRTTTPLLAWHRPSDVRPALYNLQIFEGSRKVLSAFPRGLEYRVPRGRLRTGHQYIWRVWPFLASGRFTSRPVGVSAFTVVDYS